MSLGRLLACMIAVMHSKSEIGHGIVTCVGNSTVLSMSVSSLLTQSAVHSMRSVQLASAEPADIRTASMSTQEHWISGFILELNRDVHSFELQPGAYVWLAYSALFFASSAQLVPSSAASRQNLRKARRCPGLQFTLRVGHSSGMSW